MTITRFVLRLLRLIVVSTIILLLVRPAATQMLIQISDVIGLLNQLAIRPQAGVGFSANRAAVINSSGQIDGAVGNLSDCIRVDGSSGPCFGGGTEASGASGTSGASGATGAAGPKFADGEVLLGIIDGTNNVFTLNNSPSPATSLHVYANGMRLEQGIDYSLTGNVITFKAGAVPQLGYILLADYRY